MISPPGSSDYHTQATPETLKIMKWAMVFSVLLVPTLVYAITEEPLVLLLMPLVAIADYTAYGIIKRNLIKQQAADQMEEDN